jgi:hypothetical protein
MGSDDDRAKLLKSFLPYVLQGGYESRCTIEHSQNGTTGSTYLTNLALT